MRGEPIILGGAVTSTSGFETPNGIAGAEKSMRSPARSTGANKAQAPLPIKTARTATELEHRKSISSSFALYRNITVASTYSDNFFSGPGADRIDMVGPAPRVDEGKSVGC
jgi:hypothetical protein